MAYLVYGGIVVASIIYAIFFDVPELRIDADSGTLILAGLIVGLGTRFGSGCTSGHEVCGISRLLMRSVVATLIFMLTGFITARTTTLIGTEMKLPATTQIDRRLIIGSALFGIGRGIAGFCPGPALVGLGMGLPKAVLFVVAMLSGMVLYEVIERWRGG